jgi:hypothetical protein
LGAGELERAAGRPDRSADVVEQGGGAGQGGAEGK